MRSVGQIALGVFLAALLTEGALQLFDRNTYSRFVNDPQSGLLTFLPNATLAVSGACYENTIRTNRLGLYAPEYVREKPANVFRIAFIGSSFVEAVQVPLEKNVTRILQEKMNASEGEVRYEVMPFAFSGNGTYLDLLYFRRFAAPYAPDLVIDLTTDFYLDKNAETATYPPRFDADGNLVLDLSEASKSDMVVGLKNVLRKSKLAMNLAKKGLLIKNLLTKIDTREGSEMLPPGTETHGAVEPSKALWDKEDAILRTFQRIAGENRAQFMLVSWVSDLKDMAAHTDFGKGLAAVSEKRGFPYLDLQPILLDREKREGQKPVLSCDGHWNETGHRWAAEELFAFLQAHPQLLKKL